MSRRYLLSLPRRFHKIRRQKFPFSSLYNTALGYPSTVINNSWWKTTTFEIFPLYHTLAEYSKNFLVRIICTISEYSILLKSEKLVLYQNWFVFIWIFFKNNSKVSQDIAEYRIFFTLKVIINQKFSTSHEGHVKQVC